MREIKPLIFVFLPTGLEDHAWKSSLLRDWVLEPNWGVNTGGHNGSQCYDFAKVSKYCLIAEMLKKEVVARIRNFQMSNQW